MVKIPEFPAYRCEYNNNNTTQDRRGGVEKLQNKKTKERKEKKKKNTVPASQPARQRPLTRSSIEKLPQNRTERNYHPQFKIFNLPQLVSQSSLDSRFHFNPHFSLSNPTATVCYDSLFLPHSTCAVRFSFWAFQRNSLYSGGGRVLLIRKIHDCIFLKAWEDDDGGYPPHIRRY